jgi:lipid A ethanolaminephosphotransferase
MQPFIALFNKIKLTTNQLIIIVCCYVVFILNIPFFSKTAHAVTALSEYDLGFLLSVPILLLSLTLTIISIVTVQGLVKPILIAFVMTSTLIFYASSTYGIIFDYGMMQNTLETDPAEIFTYINLYAVLFIFLLGGVPTLAIAKVKVIKQPFLKDTLQRLKLTILSVMVISITLSLYYSDYASVGRNNRILTKYITPFPAYVATYKYIHSNYFSPPLTFTLLDTTPTIGNENINKSVTVLVIGETARAASFSLNGYQKNTNSYTERYPVVSFENMTSCGTSTAVSVPCMFSKLTQQNYNKRQASSQQNLLDIASLAGVDVLWVDNNSSCKGVCQRVNAIKIKPHKSKKNCDGEYCFDEVLLKPLQEKLSHLEHQSTLIVLHMIGSHGPTYYRRYPKALAQFLPDCPRSDIQNCSDEELINTYDNTIAYTDYVLSNIISQLDNLSTKQEVKTAMLYVSDHGESLGENGVYLHGLPYVFAPKNQTHIPMIYWQDNQVDIDKTCLLANAKQAYSHDNIFDSVLGLLSVNSLVYNKENDLFSDCKTRGLIAREKHELTKQLQVQ